MIGRDQDHGVLVSRSSIKGEISNDEDEEIQDYSSRAKSKVKLIESGNIAQLVGVTTLKDDWTSKSHHIRHHTHNAYYGMRYYGQLEAKVSLLSILPIMLVIFMLDTCLCDYMFYH